MINTVLFEAQTCGKMLCELVTYGSRHLSSIVLVDVFCKLLLALLAIFFFFYISWILLQDVLSEIAELSFNPHTKLLT